MLRIAISHSGKGWNPRLLLSTTLRLWELLLAFLLAVPVALWLAWLLFGPHTTPVFRYGDDGFCEVRGEVILCGLTVGSLTLVRSGV
jgi:hypothetical protein